MRERLVGVFVLLSIAIVVSLVMAKGKTTHLFEDRITYHAFLRNAQGLAADSRVKVSGIEVGRVSSLGISRDNRIHVKFFVYEDFQNLIRSDSHGALSKLALVGDAVIEITSGSPELPVLPDGSEIEMEEPMTVDELLGELTPIMGKVKQTFDDVAEIVGAIEPEKINKSSADFAQTMANLNAVSTDIAKGQGVIGKALYDKQMERDVSESLHHLANTMALAEKRLQELEPVFRNMDTLSSDSQALTQELTGLVGDSRELVTQMNSAMGTINTEVQQLPELITRMQLVLESTDRMLEGMQRIWPISSAIVPTEAEKIIKVHPVNE